MSKYDWLYFSCIRALKDDQLYNAATIAILGRDLGLFGKNLDFQSERLKMQRVRISLGRLASLANFPDQGDGLVKIREQAPIPGWFGSRWKQLLP